VYFPSTITRINEPQTARRKYYSCIRDY